ncbi:hypothetical protein EMF73_26845 [Klebsiella pneumoniae]|nr:hypothetical protein EMF73_26845 [Klebsiella pneumoniae]
MTTKTVRKAAPPEPDPRDARIAELERQVLALVDQVVRLPQERPNYVYWWRFDLYPSYPVPHQPIWWHGPTVETTSTTPVPPSSTIVTTYTTSMA